ncbi:caspase family protein [Lewinella sp. W8]|uniref:caspase family protein n=1 Tax=Lewinella sp. W8 TaxID=2528208 RepID=UPI00156487AB|nr:caspase family protein [Lewinella sp. W8]
MKHHLGKSYMLVIAIDRYRDHRVTPLRDTVQNVKKLVNFITKHYTFNDADITELYNEDATEEAIDQAFLQLRNRLKAEDSLLIIFSGQSFYREVNNESYLIPYDGSSEGISHNISSTNLATIYLRDLKAENVCLLANAIITPSIIQQLRSYQDNGINTFQLLTTGYSHGSQTDEEKASHHFVDPLIDYLKRHARERLSMRELLQSGVDYLGQYYRELKPVYFELNDNDWIIEGVTEEDLMWQHISAKPTKASLLKYMLDFPDGKYASTAHMIHSTLLSEAAWHDAQAEDTIRAYRNFIILHETSAYVEQANQRIEAIRQAADRKTKGGGESTIISLPDTSNIPTSKSPSKRRLVIQPDAKDLSKEDIRSQIIINKPKTAKPLYMQEPNGGDDNDELLNGKLLCQIPRRMQIGQGYTCEIRIAPYELKQEILSVGMDLESSDSHDIKISRVMVVALEEVGGGSNFKITSETMVEQLIATRDYTFWRYNIVPQRIGQYKLLVKVTAKINTENFGERQKSICVWDKEVQVKNENVEIENVFDIVKMNDSHETIDLERMRELLAEDRIQEVMDELKSFLKGFDLNLNSQLVLIMQRFRAIKNQYVGGIIQPERYSTARTYITHQLIGLIDQISVKDQTIVFAGVNADGRGQVFDRIKDYLDDLV